MADPIEEKQDATEPEGGTRRKDAREATGSAVQTTVAALHGMIRGGEWTPGTLLPPQRDLARMLNVSRTTLREALSILLTTGEIAARESGRGFVCTDPHERQATPSWRFAARYSLKEVYQFRYVVESYAAQLAAISHSAQEIAELKESLEGFRAAARERDLPRYAQRDFEFHQIIMRTSSNKLLVDMHQTFANVMLESQRLPAMRPGDLWLAVHEHERIVEAIEMNDPDGANYYMRKHIHMGGSRSGLAPHELP